MSADCELKCRVSREAKVRFDVAREEMGLSTNQFLKFLVLTTAGYDFDEDHDDQTFDNDEDVRRALMKWLRGK